MHGLLILNRIAIVDRTHSTAESRDQFAELANFVIAVVPVPISHDMSEGTFRDRTDRPHRRGSDDSTAYVLTISRPAFRHLPARADLSCRVTAHSYK